MSVKSLLSQKLPVIFSTLALLLLIPLLIMAVSGRTENRKEAAEAQVFPQVDLNGDGVVNNIDLQIFREKFASPQP